MVSVTTITGMVLQTLISIVLPVGAIIYLARKKRFSWKAFGIGVLVFVLFSQILEKLLHTVMIDPTTMTLKWSSNPYLFAIYGGLAAGIFEEMGRYLAFKFVLKKQRSFDEGVSFGVGHGGVEAVLIGFLGAVNYLIIAIFINSGTYDQIIGSSVPADQAAILKGQIIQTGFWVFLLGGLERVFAFIIQMALSLMVLHGVKSNRFTYVLYAIGIHALFDFFAGLYQTHIIPSVLIIEAIIFVFTIGLGYYIYRAKKAFADLQ